jgi:hypothetical protein
MKRLSSSQPIGTDPDGCRHLAARVIHQAFRDLAKPAGSDHDQESARDFLSGSSMLTHWCAVARVDPHRMIARAKHLTALGNRLRHAQGTDGKP